MTTPTDDIDPEKLFGEISAARADGKDVSEVLGSPAPVATPEPEAESQPAPAAESNDEPPEPPPASAPAPAEAPIDWSVLPPAVKAAYDKAENDRRAAIGRAAAAQRKADLLQKQMQHAPAPVPTAAPEATPSALQKEFPELDEAMKKEMEARERKLVSLLRHELEDTTAKVKADALEAVFPGWHTTMASDDFQYWLTTQDEHARKKWEGNSVGDYAALLRDFHKANDPTSAPTAAEIIAERQARLKSATSVQGRQTPANPTGEPDPSSDGGEAYFNYLARRREKESARR